MTYEVTESGDIDPARPADQFSIAVPEWVTLVLVEAELTDGGTAVAVTIQPEFGTTSEWVVDKIGDGIPAEAADAFQRLKNRVAVYCPERNLFFRSKPNVATDPGDAGPGEVKWRITLIEGAAA